jgi:hypothetical protein
MEGYGLRNDKQYSLPSPIFTPPSEVLPHSPFSRVRHTPPLLQL